MKAHRNAPARDCSTFPGGRMNHRVLVFLTLIGGSLPSMSAAADVDPDCTAAQSALCAVSRIADARAADESLAPVLAAMGWARPCVSLMYVAGDAGEADALSITLHGAKGADAATCATSSARLKRAQLSQVAARVKSALRAHAGLIKHTDMLQITDGNDTQIQLHLP